MRHWISLTADIMPTQRFSALRVSAIGVWKKLQEMSGFISCRWKGWNIKHNTTDSIFNKLFITWSHTRETNCSWMFCFGVKTLKNPEPVFSVLTVYTSKTTCPVFLRTVTQEHGHCRGKRDTEISRNAFLGISFLFFRELRLLLRCIDRELRYDNAF